MAKIGIKLPIQVNLPDDWIEQIVNRLRNDPEAEWVEIVRCKGCRHGVDYYHEGLEFVCSITDEQVETMGVENPDMLQKLRCAELIQCADCKNADFSAHNHGTCYCMEHSCYMHEDDFCSRGVRDSV